MSRKYVTQEEDSVLVHLHQVDDDGVILMVGEWQVARVAPNGTLTLIGGIPGVNDEGLAINPDTGLIETEEDQVY